jgi:hypothetical protein
LPSHALCPYGARADVDRVLQHARDRAVVLGRHEQDGIGGLDLVAKRLPGRRHLAGRIFILVVERQGADLDHLQLE